MCYGKNNTNMIKKFLLISLLTISVYAAENVEFQYAETNSERQFPTNQNYILSYNNVLKNVTASVVNISIVKKATHKNTVKPKETQITLGSGVIVSKNGYIVTNYHVIKEADKIKVTLNGEKKVYEAKVIGKDAKSDIAIIKIDAKELDVITFYNSDDVKVGDIVFAIGNPYGLGETITQGIVSATGRSGVGIVEYEDFIQTDASINPGNSGGALINSAGHLIGINSANISKGGSNVGIGFAIPSNMLKTIATKLINEGEYNRPYLGVYISDVNEDMSSFYNNSLGALITHIQNGAPAQKAGLRIGDLITKIDEKIIQSARELKNTIGSYSTNKTVKIEFLRDKELLTKNIYLKIQTKKRK